MIRIAICDDNRKEARITKSLLLSFMEWKANTPFHVMEYSSSREVFVSLTTQAPCQIYLLDILMPGRNGIDLGREIHSHNPSAILIYLSSSPDFALDAFHVFAFQYLLKPVTKDKLYPVLAKALLHLRDTDTGSFLLKTKNGIVTLECGRIQYVEYLNHMIEVHMDDGSIHTSITMRNNFDDMIKSLTGLPFFIKPHKSFLLNMNYVASLLEKDFTLQDSTRIPISRNNYTAVKKLYIDFMLNKGYGGKKNEL